MMKAIGLIGGMTCESSVKYYQIINETARARLGGHHSAKSIMVSVDFGEIEPLMDKGNWEKILDILVTASKSLEKSGADFIVICTNTMHKLAEDIQKQVQIPILHIVDVTAEHIQRKGLSTVGLLGTRFTMEEDFYKGRLERKYGLNVVVPSSDEREIIDRIIYDELSVGEINPLSRKAYLKIIHSMNKAGAEGVILGCTEIGLLVKESDCNIPLFDTTKIHAVAAVEYALK